MVLTMNSLNNTQLPLVPASEAEANPVTSDGSGNKRLNKLNYAKSASHINGLPGSDYTKNITADPEPGNLPDLPEIHAHHKTEIDKCAASPAPDGSQKASDIIGSKSSPQISSPASFPVVSTNKIKFGTVEKSLLLKELSFEANLLAWRCNLTDDEAAAIHAYTRNEYFQGINSQFRSLPLHDADIFDAQSLKQAGVKNSDLADLIAALARGLKKLPAAQTDPSHFVCLGRNVTMAADELHTYAENAEVTMPTFISTTISSNEMISEGWWNNKDQALFIYQRIDGNGRDITPFSAIPGEREILFLPHTKFQVMFMSEPTETLRGIPDDGTPVNGNAKVTKMLIGLQEIPSEKQIAAAQAEKEKAEKMAEESKLAEQNRQENLGNYFGMR
jgi:hypothetical protein